MQHPVHEPAAQAAALPQLMGILNVTPDSFSDGNTLTSCEAVVQRAQKLIEGGATWLDLGAESTRPNAEPISVETELQRLEPPLRALLGANLAASISIDTRRAQVAARALELGAQAINDVSALQDANMAEVLRTYRVPVVLMHWAGPGPVGGDHGVQYIEVVQDVCAGLVQVRDRAVQAGIAAHNIWLDPGLGFGKSFADNLALTRNLHKLVALGHKVVFAPSRKRFLQQIVGQPSRACDAATAAVCAVAAMQGAHVLRVHDPRAVRDAMLVGAALRPL